MNYRKVVLFSSVLIISLLASFLPLSGGAVAVPFSSPPTGYTSVLNNGPTWVSDEGAPGLGEVANLIVNAEVGIGENSRTDHQYEILDGRDAGFASLHLGDDWDLDHCTTSIAFGDVDGDGLDEIGISRYAIGDNAWKYQILDDEDHNFDILDEGPGLCGQPAPGYSGCHSWAPNAHASCIAFGDVDGDGLDEVGIAIDAQGGVRYQILDDANHTFLEMHAGGSDYDEYQGASCIAFGNIDADECDEVGIAIGPGGGDRFQILDDANHGFSIIHHGGSNWGSNYYATCIAFGDVDFDGFDEVGITRCASSGMMYQIVDDADADVPFGTLHQEDDWNVGYPTCIAFGDVDLDGYDEVGITKWASSGWRCKILDGADGGFDELMSWGAPGAGNPGWGDDTFATCIAFGDVDFDGFDEIGMTRDRGSNEDTPCYWIFDDANNNFGQLSKGGNTWAQYGGATCIAFGDVDGGSLVVGAPVHSVQTVVDEIVAVINTPPKHNGVNNEPNKYTATYKNSVQDQVTESVTSKSGWALTLASKASYGVDKIFKVSLETSCKIDKKHERETATTYTTEFTQAVTAYTDDYCILATTEYHVYQYKVLSPADEAVIDGEQQYFLLTVPTGPPCLVAKPLPWWYPRCHTLGDIRTYPYDESQFIRYDADHLIFDKHVWKDYYDGGGSTTTTGCVKEEVSEKEKETVGTKISLKASVSVGTQTTGAGFSVQADFEEEKIETHQTKLTEQTCISTYVAGGLDTHWKYYEVKPVFYSDNEFGYPVVDYVITDMGLYYLSILDLYSGLLSRELLESDWWQTEGQSLVGTTVIIPDWVSCCSTIQVPIPITKIPIRIVNAEDIRSMDITLPYDPDIFSPTKVSKGTLTAESSLEWDVGDDIIQIALEDSAGINGDGSIVTIGFEVVGSLGDYYTLAPTVSVNEGTGQEDESIAIRSGLFRVKSIEEIRGDCDGDGDIDSVDALLALKMSAGKIEVNLVGDMNEDDQVAPSDAAEMLSMGAGKAVLDFYWPLQGIDKGIKPGFEEFEG